jgi:hypothetical protein
MHEIHTFSKREAQPNDVRSEKTYELNSWAPVGGASHLFPPRYFEKSKMKREGNITNTLIRKMVPSDYYYCAYYIKLCFKFTADILSDIMVSALRELRNIKVGQR